MPIISHHYRPKRAVGLAIAALLAVAAYGQQLSSSAYRVLGQLDFRHSGVNMVQGVELNTPSSIALDARGGLVRIYVADTANARVLGWRDTRSYAIGDPPGVVLGQPGPQSSSAQGIGQRGFSGPTGLAVDPATGNLYAADTANHRVLRFSSPFDNPNRVEPDAVYGQPSFAIRTAGTTAGSFNQPRGLAFDPAGNLWVADTGNHRVLRLNAASLSAGGTAAADAVIGQRDFVSGNANAGGSVSASGFDTPIALAFDPQGNLYVSDFNNARVLRFAAPVAASNAAATAVWGQQNFSSRAVPQQATGSSLRGPNGLTVNSDGDLVVAVPRDNRVMVFATNTAIGAAAKNILGQSDPAATTANAGASPLASANSLSAPVDVKADPNGNLFISDQGNHRVLQVPPGTKLASKVWGQSDFVSNGANQIEAASVNSAFKMAIDYSAAPYALYVSDTNNNRILIWRDSVKFRNGDPADLVIGQPNLRTGAPNVDSPGSPNPSSTSLSGPAGIVVSPFDGTLYVADAGNNRILRYRRPVDQAGRITPDAVLGQMDFTSSAAALVSATSLSLPTGLALGPDGTLFVSDTGNHRVLEYAAGAGTGAAAIRVFGQPNMTTGSRPGQQSAQTLTSPQGIAVDQASNLYVADTGANRVLIFPNTRNAAVVGATASFVLGQPTFASAGAGAGGAGLRSPSDVAVDSTGNIYIADNGNNRVLSFDSLVFLPIGAAAAAGVLGQQNTSGTNPNGTSPDGLPTAASLFGPTGLYVDRQDTLYVGDIGNNRVLQFLKAASVSNAAALQPSVPVAQGSLATIKGSGLAADQQTAAEMPWPLSLMNRQIVVNDELMSPLYYVAPGQFNFQLPTSAPVGTGRIAVRVADTGELIAGGTLLVSAAAPGLFTAGGTGTGQAAALNQDYTLNSPSNPAPAGSTLVLYGTGQGQVGPPVPDGTPAAAETLSNTVAIPTTDGASCLNNQPSMCVLMGNSVFGTVRYSGLAPGFVGLWQINVTIPAGLPAGNVPVRVIVNGTPSNTVTVTVR